MLTVMVAGAGLLAGAGLGRGLRALLWRLRRGARVAPGWCESGVAVALTAPLAGVAAGVVAPSWVGVWAGLGVLAVAVAATDLAHRRIPNALTVPALPVLVLLTVPLGAPAVLAGLLGAVLALVAHAAIHLAAPGALGAGDVKLAAGLGVPLAAGSWEALLVAPVLTAGLVALLAAATGQRAVPLGPAAGGVTWSLVAVHAVAA